MRELAIHSLTHFSQIEYKTHMNFTDHRECIASIVLINLDFRVAYQKKLDFRVMLRRMVTN